MLGSYIERMVSIEAGFRKGWPLDVTWRKTLSKIEVGVSPQWGHSKSPDHMDFFPGNDQWSSTFGTPRVVGEINWWIGCERNPGDSVWRAVNTTSGVQNVILVGHFRGSNTPISLDTSLFSQIHLAWFTPGFMHDHLFCLERYSCISAHEFPPIPFSSDSSLEFTLSVSVSTHTLVHVCVRVCVYMCVCMRVCALFYPLYLLLIFQRWLNVSSLLMALLLIFVGSFCFLAFPGICESFLCVWAVKFSSSACLLEPITRVL